MGAENLKSPADIEAELHPHVVIFANSLERFGQYSEFLSSNGYPAQFHQFPVESALNSPREGTVYFVSFNLKSTDPLVLSKQIELNLKMTCIVFAEDEGIGTATQLSSAKMTQTLQHPYTQKNFLMAMQTIVKKRKEDFEKEMRQKNHRETRQFKMRAENEIKTDGVYIQKGPEAMAAPSTLIKGDGKQMAKMILQQASQGKGFFVIQDAVSPVGKSRTLNVAGSKNLATTPAEAMKAEDPAVISTPQIQRPEALEELIPADRVLHQPKATAYKSMREELMSEYWAILAMLFLGISICCYCLYEILFS